MNFDIDGVNKIHNVICNKYKLTGGYNASESYLHSILEEIKVIYHTYTYINYQDIIIETGSNQQDEMSTEKNEDLIALQITREAGS